MKSNIHVYKISDKLYRVLNKQKKTVKDCWILNGEIQINENIHHVLTPTEMMALEMELF